MKVDLSAPYIFNEIYKPLLYTKANIIILYGGRDGAKSHEAANMTLFDTMYFKYSRKILNRRNLNTIKDSQFQTLVDIIGKWRMNHKFTINTNPARITYRPNGNFIVARGADNPDNIKSFKDSTGGWIEEADQTSAHNFELIQGTMRNSYGVPSRLYITFNPENESSWINDEFFPPKQTYESEDGKFTWIKSVRDDAVILHTNHEHNIYVSPEKKRYHQRLGERKNESDYRMNLYRVYDRGLWGRALKGVIFTNWRTYKLAPRGQKIYGLDFGYTHKMALVETIEKDHEVYADLLFYKSGCTTGDLIKALPGLGVSKNDIIYADSAEPDRIQEIEEAGYTIYPCYKNKGSVNSSIDHLLERKLFIHEDATKFHEELNEYHWDEDRHGKPLERPVEKKDDAIAALRYARYSHYKRIDEDDDSAKILLGMTGINRDYQVNHI
jgi:phage terminase large subunit